MTREPGTSVRVRLALSYAAFLMLACVLLLGATWAFLLRDVPLRYLVPNPANLPRIVDPGSYGPAVFGIAVATILVFLLVFGLGGGWLLAGRMLAPLRRITGATRAAASGSLSHRIELEGPGDEFRELADAFDTMLGRLEAHVEEQRRFAANASHELRTPLATTQALLDVARADPGHDTRELLERLHVVNTRAIALTEALLLLGRADQRSASAGDREHVDLALLAEDATETLLPTAEARGVTIETVDDPAPVVGSHALLLQLTTNLLHNAIVHNLPGRGTVRIATAARAATVVLTVENSGPPLDPRLVSTLAEPFRRGVDRTRTGGSGGHPGVGLGLAIVRSIARAHDGTLTLAPRPGGGLCTTVELPLDRSASVTVPVRAGA